MNYPNSLVWSYILYSACQAEWPAAPYVEWCYPPSPQAPPQFQATAEQMVNPFTRARHDVKHWRHTGRFIQTRAHWLSAAARVWLTVNGYDLGEEGTSHGLHRKKSAWTKWNVLSLLKIVEARGWMALPKRVWRREVSTGKSLGEITICNDFQEEMSLQKRWKRNDWRGCWKNQSMW